MQGDKRPVGMSMNSGNGWKGIVQSVRNAPASLQWPYTTNRLCYS